MSFHIFVLIVFCMLIFNFFSYKLIFKKPKKIPGTWYVLSVVFFPLVFVMGVVGLVTDIYYRLK